MPRCAGHPMCSNAVEPENHAAVLQSPIRIQQLGPNGTNAGAQCMRHHLPQPAAVDHLDVIIEEQQDLARRDGGGTVVQISEVERPRKCQHLNTGHSCQSVQQLKRRRIAAAIVDDQDLEAGIVRSLEQAIDARRQKIVVIPGGDDHRHQWRRIGYRPRNAIEGRNGWRRLDCHARSGKMLCYSAPRMLAA